MIISVFIFVSLFSYSNCVSQSGWLQQNSGINSNLNSVYFKNSQTGWCLGNEGKILKTINGGVNWFQTNSGTSKNLSSLSFSSLHNAFAVGDSGTILNSTDEGNSWINSKFPNRNYNFTSVFFVNDSIGFAGGIQYDLETLNKIFKTSNGGNNWDSLVTANGMYEFINTIFFINNNMGWIIKGYGIAGIESLYKTIDGGLNWFYQFNLSTLYSVLFINPQTGWTSGDGSGFKIHKTTNGGDNWNACIFCGVDAVYSFFFTNNSKGWGAGLGGVYNTINAGTNWTFQSSNHKNVRYNSIYFTDSLTGWVVGDSGIILKTTTGGVITGFSNTSSEIPDRYYLSQNYPNPFNPVTNLEFGISNLGFVSLKIYDVSGKEIKTLVNEIKQPGMYKVEFDGSSLASGIYFYTIEAGSFKQTKRMLLLK